MNTEDFMEEDSDRKTYKNSQVSNATSDKCTANSHPAVTGRPAAAFTVELSRHIPTIYQAAIQRPRPHKAAPPGTSQIAAMLVKHSSMQVETL